MLVAEKKITVAEFRQMEFEGEDAYYELINGQIVKKAAPTSRHQDASTNLVYFMSHHARTHNLGKVYHAPLDVFLDDFNQEQPDLIFVSKKNLGIIDPNNGIVGVPDLVVEIISPSSVRIDRHDKKKAYASVGVPEYWLIDPNNETVEIFNHTDGRLQLRRFAAVEGKVQSEVLEGFEVEVSAIFMKT